MISYGAPAWYCFLSDTNKQKSCINVILPKFNYDEALKAVNLPKLNKFIFDISECHFCKILHNVHYPLQPKSFLTTIDFPLAQSTLSDLPDAAQWNGNIVFFNYSMMYRNKVFIYLQSFLNAHQLSKHPVLSHICDRRCQINLILKKKPIIASSFYIQYRWTNSTIKISGIYYFCLLSLSVAMKTLYKATSFIKWVGRQYTKNLTHILDSNYQRLYQTKNTGALACHRFQVYSSHIKWFQLQTSINQLFI